MFFFSSGSDNYGVHFFIGFLGNDPHPTTATSTSSLFLCVIPRYAVNTYVTVTSQFGSVSRSAVNRDILTFPLSTDLMGCSENGIAEIDDKGVEINSTHEISVQVYNRESGSEDYYTALPVDILSTRYTSISKGATGEVAELMIIGTDADTAVDLTLPAYTHAQVTLNSDTISAGETLSFTLQDREAFHLSVPNYSVSGFHINSTKPVALITGDRKDVNDHSVDQVPPESELGKHYVLVPANPADDNRDTTYIIQAIADGNTIVSRYLSSTTMQNYT